MNIGKLVWDADFNPEDMGYDEGTDGIIAILHCTNCSARVQYDYLTSEDKHEQV